MEYIYEKNIVMANKYKLTPFGNADVEKTWMTYFKSAVFG